MSHTRKDVEEATPESANVLQKHIDTGDRVIRYLGNELQKVSTNYKSLSEWRMRMDQQMIANAVGMESMQRKLDLLLDARSSPLDADKGKGQGTFTPETPLVSIERQQLMENEEDRMATQSFCPAPVSTEHTASASSPSHWRGEVNIPALGNNGYFHVVILSSTIRLKYMILFRATPVLNQLASILCVNAIFCAFRGRRKHTTTPAPAEATNTK